MFQVRFGEKDLFCPHGKQFRSAAVDARSAELASVPGGLLRHVRRRRRHAAGSAVADLLADRAARGVGPQGAVASEQKGQGLGEWALGSDMLGGWVP